MTRIVEPINQSTKEDHQFLKTEAETIRFTADTKITEYIKEHKEVRQRMLAAKYPNISDEATTVDFLIEGLKANASLSTIVFHLLAHKPTSIKDFTRKFKELYTFNQTLSTASGSNIPPQNFTGDYGSLPQPNVIGDYTRFRPSRRYDSRALTPQRSWLPFTGKPCQFHTSLGVRPQHTHNECRDPRHRKHHRRNPRANFAHTTWNYAPNTQTYPHQFQHHQRPAKLPPPPPPPEVMSETATEPSKISLDSGAHPSHITNPNTTMTPLTTHTLTQSATNQMSKCTHYDLMRIRLPSNNMLLTLAVANRHIKHNLLSVHDLAARYGHVTFTAKAGYVINTRSDKPIIIAKAHWRNNQYQITATLLDHTKAFTSRTIPYKRVTSHNKIQPIFTTQNFPDFNHLPVTTQNIPPLRPSPNLAIKLKSHHNPSTPAKISSVTLQTHNWHLRLNHAHTAKLSLTAKHRLIPLLPAALPSDTAITCRECSQAKQHPEPNRSTVHHYAPGAYISSDTCGPVKPTSTHGKGHILTIICAATRFAIAHFIKDTKDIPSYIERTLYHIKHRMFHPLSDIRTDTAIEFTSQRIKALTTNINSYITCAHLINHKKTRWQKVLTELSWNQPEPSWLPLTSWTTIGKTQYVTESSNTICYTIVQSTHLRTTFGMETNQQSHVFLRLANWEQYRYMHRKRNSNHEQRQRATCTPPH